MEPTNTLLASEVSKLRIVWFCLVQNETPEGFNRQQTEEQLIEFAKELVVMGKVTPEKVRATLEEQDYNKKIIELIELVTKAAYDVKEENFNSRLRGLVKQYEEHQKTVAAAKEKEAEAKLVKHNRQDLRDKIAINFDNLKKQVAEQDPQSTTGEYLEASREYMEPQTIIDEDTPKTTGDLVRSTSTIAEVDLPATMAPMIGTTTELSPVLSAFKDSLENKIQEAAPKALPEKVEALAAELVAETIIHPETYSQKADEIIDRVVLKLEKDGIAVNDSIKNIVSEFANFKIPETTSLQVESVLAHEYESQAGLDPETAKEIAKLVVFNKIPDIAFAISKSAKHAPEDSPEKRRTRQVNIFNDINRRVLDSLSEQIPQSTLNRLKNLSTYSRVYEFYTNQENDRQESFSRDENARQSQAAEWLKNELQSRIREKINDEARQAIEGWINGSVGTTTGTSISTAIMTSTVASTSTAVATTTAAPIVGIIVGEATPAWVMAGIGHGLMNGTAVYAGTLATGEVMFVAPASLATAQALITAGGAEVGALAGQTTIPIPVVGAIVGAIIGFIVANFPKIWRWTKEHGWKPAVAIVTAILGAIIGPILGLGALAGGILGGIAGGTIAWAAPSGISGFATGGISGVMQPVGQLAGTVFTGLSSLVVVEIATPIIVIIMSIPVVVALLLFIINNSAFVVPSSTGFGSPISNQGGFSDNASCPITGGILHAGSYNPTTQTGHGGNSYWSPATGVGGTSCRYSLPQQSGCLAPTVGSNNICYQQTGLARCDFYGFSADFFPPAGGTLAPVYLPLIDGKEVSWSFNGVYFPNGGGANGYSYGFTDTTGKYSLLLTHVQSISNPNSLTNVKSGTQASSLYNQGSNTHLHIEFQLDGVYQRPENYFCGS